MRKRPQWLGNFNNDHQEDKAPLKVDLNKQFSGRAISLLSLSVAGFMLDLISVTWLNKKLMPLLLAASWAIIVLLLIVEKPRTAPLNCLIIFISICATQLIFRINDPSSIHTISVPSILSSFSAFVSIVIILNQPLRDPALPSDEIAVPSTLPTCNLRSPEELLTPWQFMTVSWMSPLLSIGSKRQLNDEDVWSLPREFQHKGLHERFRELHGSVVRRLLKANGLDLFILTALGLLELAAQLASPTLLQLLLRSMEDGTIPMRAAVVYALISLMARLVQCQSSVFSTWYGRRCYERSRGEMITMLHEKVLSRKIIGGAADMEKDTEVQSAGMGKILNMMRNDVYEVAQRFWEFQSLVTTPLGLILSVVLVWQLIGWPALFGVITIVIAQIANVLITRILLRWERVRRAATDTRLQKSSQFVEAIRHLRWYGWQEHWLDGVLTARKKELKKRVKTTLLGVLIKSMNTFASHLFPVVAFYAYTAWAGLPLRIDIAFPALQLFQYLETSLRDIPELIMVLLHARIGVQRIESFMSEPVKEDNNSSTAVLSERNAPFSVENGSFSWPGHVLNVLHNINLRFPVGLTVVLGEVGSGKTALLEALLGEMDTRDGWVTRPNTSFGYCTQSPWLQSLSIKDNILFSYPYEEERYKEVIDSCQLTVDLKSFKDGDFSHIGENGIGLSGGQRARIALARAVYSPSSILLLDDPLSALDHQTADAIVKKCLQGPLMVGRTIILVTHRVDLVQEYAQQMVEISAGRAHVLNHGVNLEHVSRRISGKSNDNQLVEKEDEGKNILDKFLEDEKRVHGGVKAKVYWEYVKAGKLKYWAILVMMMVISRFSFVAHKYFLKEWGEAYDRQSSTSSIISRFFRRFPSPEVDVSPWLWAFFGIAIVRSIITIFVYSISVIIVYAAGQRMFKDIMHCVSHATFRFYDVTPIGRLMNRLTSDIGIIDGNINLELRSITENGLTWISSIIVIASVTPIFLIFSILLSMSFVFIFSWFLPASQSLRRLEMVSLSPLMSNFGALLSGLTTVRAFRAQSRFQDHVIEVTDAFQKMDHFFWSLQAWLMYRFDILSACSTFLLTLLALYTGVSPGLTAFVLNAAKLYVIATHELCRRYGKLQMDFVSVERIVELLHIEQEPSGFIEPPAAWPTYHGDINFNNVTIRYAPHLTPALHNISLCIPGGSTTALLGRTGSGKSTLAHSLLGTILPSEGNISIDGINVAECKAQALRHRITFLAQDPVLFPGSMRQNLDPLQLYTDEECSSILQRICGKYYWTLDTKIDTGGRNLSQGQRQLVGLSRAVLRRSSVIILDEATASIDAETAETIQHILREEMKSSTVITIAHRLEAVKGADFFVRLDGGMVIEQGPITARMTDENLVREVFSLD